MSETLTNLTWREELRELKDLKPHPNNPRRITKEAFNTLVKNMSECGYIGRITINHANLILGGNQRLKALQHLTYKEIPVLVPSRPLTQEEEERIHIIDNISAGEWDTDVLGNLFDADKLIGWGMPPAVIGESHFQLTESTEEKIKEKEIKKCPSCGELLN